MDNATKAKIIAMAINEEPRTLIAKMAGCHTSSVFSVITRARRQGVNIPYLKSGPKLGSKFPSGTSSPRVYTEKQVMAALAPHAKPRDLTTHELASKILKTVAENNLVDAVLDDAEELNQDG